MEDFGFALLPRLSGIRFHSLINGHPLSFSSRHYFYYMLRGIRRSQGDTLHRSLRSPITVSHLWTMFAFLSCSLSPTEKRICVPPVPTSRTTLTLTVLTKTFHSIVTIASCTSKFKRAKQILSV